MSRISASVASGRFLIMAIMPLLWASVIFGFLPAR